jgi:hypothetical protein
MTRMGRDAETCFYPCNPRHPRFKGFPAGAFDLPLDGLVDVIDLDEADAGAGVLAGQNGGKGAWRQRHHER